MGPLFEVATGTAGPDVAIRSNDARFLRVECRYCGWSDHNTAWHEQMERQAIGGDD